MFNMFDLHDTEIDNKPYSWMEVNGEVLADKIHTIVLGLCRKQKISKRELSMKISKILHCNPDTVGKRLYRMRGYEWYPLPIIMELVNLYADSTDQKNKLLKSINLTIEYMRCGRNSIKCKAVKNINSELARLCGAIVADGHLYRDKSFKEGIVIIDEYEDSIKKCSKWLKETFGFCGRIEKSNQCNAWVLYITSKITTRFFNKFLQIPYGKKSDIIREPQILKHSKYRLDFAKGVILMDGSVELDYVVSLGVKSELLAKDIFEILKVNKFTVKASVGKSMYKVRSFRLNRTEAIKWIKFFSLDTEKGRKLYQMTYGFTANVKSIEEAIELLNNFCKVSNSSKITIKEILDVIRNLGSVNKKLLVKELSIGTSTLYKYLWILEQSKIIRSVKTTGGPNMDNLYSYNNNFEEWVLPKI